MPYGQYLRAKRNCSDESDFEREAKCLRSRFLNRGYSKKCLKKAYLRAKNQNRASLLHNTSCKKANPGVRLITTYSNQHQQTRDILKKYWYLLMGDEKVAKHLNPYPEITFRRCRSLRDSLVHSHYESHSAKIKETDRGSRPCHQCSYCRYILASRSLLLPNDHLFKPRFAVTCQSIGIVYIMLCECKMFYIGKTKRPFFCRIRDHVSLIQKKRMETPISRHVGLQHNFDANCLHFFALEHIPPGVRGGDYDKLLLQKEARWIHELSALQHPGMNDAFSFKPFL